ncbi:hypothetical protein NCAST_13_00940 [Nocardia asteroides NBRC 15531]|uniref:Uncharacterized protein n=1 Tax=Nocardia asteroides NBRC 15531 TaxID=1110697 RepID=U5ECC7_NOCAS|nr:hypothetical protein NCAST_13_00940 [Nocardia asteroides NBRC 15531]
MDLRCQPRVTPECCTDDAPTNIGARFTRKQDETFRLDKTPEPVQSLDHQRDATSRPKLEERA